MISPFVKHILLMLLLVPNCLAATDDAIDYDAFLKQHDMLWDRIPNRWEVAPYSGNGNVGFLFYQAKGESKNVISIYTGRHDYYDHREPFEGDELAVDLS